MPLSVSRSACVILTALVVLGAVAFVPVYLTVIEPRSTSPSSGGHAPAVLGVQPVVPSSTASSALLSPPSSSSSSSSSYVPPFAGPFYEDPSQMYWFYPLTGDYTDATGQTGPGTLLNTSCEVSFTSQGWYNPDCFGQGIVVDFTNGITPPFAFSMQFIAEQTPFDTALWSQASINNVVQIDSTNLDVVIDGTLQGAASVDFFTGFTCHVSVSVNATAACVYSNGVLAGCSAANITATTITTTTTTVLGNNIGLVGGSDPTFYGYMQYARLFRRTLTAAEAQTLYYADTAGE